VARNDVQICGTGFKKMYAGLSLSKTTANYFQCVSFTCAVRFVEWRRGKQAFRRRKYCATVERRRMP